MSGFDDGQHNNAEQIWQVNDIINSDFLRNVLAFVVKTRRCRVR